MVCRADLLTSPPQKSMPPHINKANIINVVRIMPSTLALSDTVNLSSSEGVGDGVDILSKIIIEPEDSKTKSF